MAWTDRYVTADSDGGDGTSGDPWTLAEAISNAAAGDRINIKAGTYANTTSSLTFAAAGGATTGLVWWRGYNTTIGDIDTNNALTKPAITFTTGQFITSGAYQLFSNLDISGACTTALGQVAVTAAHVRFLRCRIQNTAANAAAYAIASDANGSYLRLEGCWLNATSSADVVVTNGVTTFLGCHVDGGKIGIKTVNASSIAFCVIDNTADDGIQATSAHEAFIINTSVYSAGSDGIGFTSTSAIGMVANCCIVDSAAYGISYGATAYCRMIVTGCGFYNNASGEIQGILEHTTSSDTLGVALLNTSLASAPFTDAGSDDFSVAAVAKAKGFPGAFENETYIGYLDIGAVQRTEPSASGGGLPVLGGSVVR